jgi:hypothetical protein
MTRVPRARPGWELTAVGVILVLMLAANAMIWRARTSMLRVAMASTESMLVRDRETFNHELLQWRDGMLDDGRWAANLVGVVLDASANRGAHGLSAGERARLRALTLAQIPMAELWVLDQNGGVIIRIGGQPPRRRDVSLARQSLNDDTTLLALSGMSERDLRIAVASPLRTARGRGLVAVLDVAAADRLRSHLPSFALAGQPGRTAITFPYTTGFVGAKWTGTSGDPTVGRADDGWSMMDSSLIVVSGTLPDTMHFQLGIPRAASETLVDSREAWFHAGTALIALPLCVGVLLVGRTARSRRLRATEKSLADFQLRTAQAEVAATRAGLAAIQARLNPHFLSNALHSVSALIATDPEAAEDALDRVGDLFRYSLEQSEKLRVRVEDEWRFVRDYLLVEQMRLGARLSMELDLDPSAAECEIPPFMLQPLVENAIRHGIGPLVAGGHLRMSVRRIANRIEMVVSDDGGGADPQTIAASPGTGLRTLRARLALDHALAGDVAIETGPGQGLLVRVTLAALRDERMMHVDFGA